MSFCESTIVIVTDEVSFSFFIEKNNEHALLSKSIVMIVTKIDIFIV